MKKESLHIAAGKKAAVCMLVCLLVGCLIGCVRAPAEGTEPMGGKLSDMAAHTGSRFAAYDPDREIHITGSGIHLDSMSFPSPLRLEIISKGEIDLDTVEVVLDTAFPYTIMKLEVPITRGTEDLGFQGDQFTVLPYYVYQAYRGVDYTNLDSTVVEEFQSLTPEMLPEFHVYVINVIFSDGQEPVESETVENIELIIEGKRYRPDFGALRVFPATETHWGKVHGTYEQVLFSADGSGSAATGQVQRPYNGGLGKVQIITGFEAAEDMTLTGLHSWDENFEGDKLEIVDILVKQHSSVMGYMEYTWDGESPIDLYAGDSFSIELVFYEPRTDVLWGSYNFQICVDVNIDGELHYIPGYFYQIDLRMNYYELYAIVFDGVDMEPYYRHYYETNVNEAWRKDYAAVVAEDF